MAKLMILVKLLNLSSESCNFSYQSKSYEAVYRNVTSFTKLNDKFWNCSVRDTLVEQFQNIFGLGDLT